MQALGATAHLMDPRSVQERSKDLCTYGWRSLLEEGPQAPQLGSSARWAPYSQPPPEAWGGRGRAFLRQAED